MFTRPVSRRLFSTRLPPTIHQLLTSPAPPNTPLEINGWVKSIRRQKKVAFAVISDGSSQRGLQAVFTDIDLAKQLTNGASVRLSGQLADSPGSGQDKELRVNSVEILGECDPAKYPMQKQALSTEYLRDHCHLRARTDTISSMIRLRDEVLTTLHDYFKRQGFCYAHTPILTSNDCEGAGETFRIAPQSSSSSPSSSNISPIEFFNHPAYLTVSSQLHLEALATSISRVYTISPCFRAERSQTNRHLAEFWMLEAEWAFSERVHDICKVVEGALREVLEKHLSSYEDLPSHSAKYTEWHRAANRQEPWARITYTDAVRALSEHQQVTHAFNFEPDWGKPLQSEHERWLAEEHARGPVFVTDYPASLKPFYMRLNPDGQTVACFDLLMPGLGELVGGSLREERFDMLEDALGKHGLDLQEYGWYLDLRRYGSAPHGGFGMGFERLISWISGIENVRECIPMPRWAGKMLL